jgi:glycosyltransferase involved in cell wall biosynthesis
VKRVAHVLWRSQGGMRRHVRTLATHPPAGWETAAIYGPADLASYFGADQPFRGISRAGLLRAGRDADVIHAHGVTAGLAALVPGGPSVVLSLHVVVGGSGLTSRSRSAAALARLVASRADAVIAVSDEAARGFRSARVIPPAFDALPAARVSRPAMRVSLGSRADDVVAVVVSRLEAGKRLDLFVRAVEAAGCIGWIVGDGRDRPDVERLTKGTNVHVLGYRSDVADILAAADLFVLPSASESYGIAVAEAIDAGLPVVATRTGAIEQLADAAGVLVDVDDTEAFVRAVKELVADPDARARLAAAARQVVRPDRDALIARIGAVYDEVTGPAGAERRRKPGPERSGGADG